MSFYDPSLLNQGFLHQFHWEPSGGEVTISAVGVGGQQNLGGAVPTGVTRRIREITVRHSGTNATVITLIEANSGRVVLTIDVPAQTTRVWSSEDGRAFVAGEQPAVRSSNVTGGNTYVTVAGVET